MCIIATQKRAFLYFVATIQLTMDYSPKAIKDGVVESPSNCVIIPLAMNLPSPLWGKGTGDSSKSKCRDTNGAQHNLYLGLSPLPNNKLHKVGLLYYLSSSSSQLVLPNLYL